MTLSQEDGQLFYRLWLPLLDYVNERYHVCKDLKDMATAKGLDPAEVKKVANQLWENVDVIDSYLAKRPDLPEDHREVIKGWKRRIQGQYIMERHLKKGTIFISMDEEEVYQVYNGIIN